MKWIRYSLACSLMLISLSALAGCGTANQNQYPTGQASAVTEPEEIYTRHCANCHGGNLQGSYGPSLKNISRKYTQEEILQIIQKGKGKMPSQDYVSKEEQQKLADWLSGQR
ncbi:c-type cytochrome [Paenactinomyces guangxiensis]|uniref:Cytochrome c n=1 Tax=Paenactinomyces guangxiensis TaxID=1490290 RepID=A0A7W1WR16_9BACL|nr:cytochrome c [Paenactinomyces guangxiensis]MBA4494466.1 cytochrome c [Paenactinomyces guangxiensis]MBH8591479.1 cytochrome c [Paenactinomyces guangxiensis]